MQEIPINATTVDISGKKRSITIRENVDYNILSLIYLFTFLTNPFNSVFF